MLPLTDHISYPLYATCLPPASITSEKFAGLASLSFGYQHSHENRSPLRYSPSLLSQPFINLNTYCLLNSHVVLHHTWAVFIAGGKMSNENSPPPTPTSPSARRASFSPGQLFGRGPASNNGGTAPYPTPIATAAANAQAQQRRRLSITSLGLSGSPTQANAFARARQGSLSSGASNNTSVDESAIEEGDAPPLSTSPHSPFARRMSSGARALRDVRAGSGNANGRSSTISISAPSVKGRGLSSSIPCR